VNHESGGPRGERPGVVLVTAGAGAGIGSAVVRELSRVGWDVVITDAHERRCMELARSLERDLGRSFLALAMDVTDFHAVGDVMNRVVDARGGLHALVNNAGWNKPEPLAEMDPATWRRCIDVDLNGTFNCLRHALPVMIEAGGGAIVNIASIAAWETSTDHGAAYSAAKAGVTALTRVAAAEVGRYGIRVNSIAPGLIYNEYLRKFYPDEFFDGYAERRSLVGRVGRPEDVAALVEFLLSARAGFITGEVYGISGGVLPHA
jgi:3-oxoacyl-[acyl-carrier protein] reductase